jgi:hypothetical protein
MKVLRFKCGEPEWSVSLNELSFDVKRILQVRWRDFIEELGDAGAYDQGNCCIKALMERTFAAADSLVDGENCCS